jgi:hypothetical protein
MPDAGDQSGTGRATRNTWLAVAAAIAVVAGILNVAGQSLYLAEALSLFFYPTALSVSDGVGVLAALLFAGGFAVALAGFLAVPQSPRRKRLAIAAVLLLGAALSSTAAQLIRAVEYGTLNTPDTFTASTVVEAAAWLAFAAAALIAAVGFQPSAGESATSRYLGWAAAGLAGFFVFDLVSTILAAIAYSDAHAPSGITTGLGVVAGGSGVAAAGALVAAAAFLVVADSGRDRLLAIAAIVLGLGFLLTSIGTMIYAAADSGAGGDGKAVAADWLSAIFWLGLAFAAVCAGVGFALSRRAAEPAEAIPAAYEEPTSAG